MTDDISVAATHVLLVHGAWYGGWAWDVLVPHLESRGLSAATVELPSAQDGGALAEDAHAVRDALDAATGPTVVVGHSYGGMPVSEACAGRTDVAHLIYISAFALDVGESLLGTSEGRDIWIAVDEARAVSSVPDPVFRLFADVEPDLAAWASERVSASQTLASFRSVQTAAAWREVPTTYVVCTEDRALPVQQQEQMALRAGHVLRLPSSHTPFLSMPERVADLIAAAAASTGRSAAS